MPWWLYSVSQSDPASGLVGFRRVLATRFFSMALLVVIGAMD